MRGRERSETERRLAGMVVIGTISAADHKLNRYRVKVGDLETDWAPSAVTRSGGTRTYESRDEGEQVVMVAPGGDMTQAVIIGAISTEERQAGEKASEHRTIYPDGTVVEYDDEANAYNLTVPKGGGSVNVKSGGKVSVDGAEHVGVKSAKVVDVEGAERATLKGGGSTLTLSDSGLDVESSSPINFRCPDVLHNGRSIGDNHRHTDVEAGSDRSGPPEA